MELSGGLAVWLIFGACSGLPLVVNKLIELFEAESQRGFYNVMASGLEFALSGDVVHALDHQSASGFQDTDGFGHALFDQETDIGRFFRPAVETEPIVKVARVKRAGKALFAIVEAGAIRRVEHDHVD